MGSTMIQVSRQLTLVASICMGLPITSCKENNHKSVPTSSPPDLRLAEEPYQSQEVINQRMAIVIPYLEKATGLRIDYVPAINYEHSHQMLRDGDVDLITIGLYGGFKLLHNNPKVTPLVIQKRSFRSILIANSASLENIQERGDGRSPLSIVQNQSVGFGSRASGSTFLQPLLHLHQQEVPFLSISECFHEPNTNHLPLLVADGSIDLAFIPSLSGDPLQAIAPEVRDKVSVVWQSELSRNDLVVTAVHPAQSLKHEQLKKVATALLALNPERPEHQRVLATWGYQGFEKPNPSFPKQTLQKVADVHASTGGFPTCQNL